ncbi:MAG: hypothetical protein JNN15_13010 [Blastocatellia bacterium]|nr:hypothetical protein [Blastocatellia bacterium]
MRFQIERHLGNLGRVQQQLTELKSLRKTKLTHLEAAPSPPAPFFSPEFNPRDFVSYLLYIDAEIEHALMVQYLYAAYSLGGSQIPEKHRETVRGWQEVIFGIAKEEMGHLISVQNVLRLIGAPLNLGRENYPWDTTFYPFPFTLEPLTLDSLAKYVYAESPENWSGPIAEEVKKRVEKSTSNPHKVSELFSLLIGLLQDSDFLPDEVFDANTYPFQAKWDEWGRGYQGGQRGNTTKANPENSPDVLVVPVASRDDAVSALTQIAQQGEAYSGQEGSSPSHFIRFLDIYKKMSELAHEGWSPSRNVAINPYVWYSADAIEEDPSEGQVSDQEQDRITHPESKLWGHLFNVRYRMLLNYLMHSFELVGGLNQAGIWTPRGMIINATFGEMYNLRAIASIMVQLPLSTLAKFAHKNAGPPFLMPYTLTLPTGEANRWRLHKDLLQAARALIDQLQAICPKPRLDYLFSIREADQQLLDTVNRILAGDIKLALT